jgi:hypothetical protein
MGLPAKLSPEHRYPQIVLTFRVSFEAEGTCMTLCPTCEAPASDLFSAVSIQRRGRFFHEALFLTCDEMDQST